MREVRRGPAPRRYETGGNAVRPAVRGRAGQADGGAERTLLAVGLMLSAALCFAARDGMAKYLTGG